MTLQGKGFFTHILSRCEGGDPAAIVNVARAAGLSHVLVKIADGVKAYGVDASGNDFTAPVVQALHAAGIAVWGWHYVYGNEPAIEAKIAVQRAKALNVDGYVIDAEAEYKLAGKEAAARQFMSAVRGALNVPIALSSFRFPHYHPELPWSAFLERCDYHMPQVYWEQAHNAGAQLRESKRQCDALPNARPYIATGAAYSVGGWLPTPAEVSEFLSVAQTLGISAVNFFEWYDCRRRLPAVWEVVAEARWSGSPVVTPSTPVPVPEPEPESEPEPGPEPEPEPTPAPPVDVFANQFLTALNSRKAGQMAALYGPTAVCVLAGEVLRGPISIQAAYSTFFSTLETGVTVTMPAVKVQDDLRFLTWKAGTITGYTTLVLDVGKIALDYTFFA